MQSGPSWCCWYIWYSWWTLYTHQNAVIDRWLVICPLQQSDSSIDVQSESIGWDGYVSLPVGGSAGVSGSPPLLYCESRCDDLDDADQQALMLLSIYGHGGDG